MRLPVALFPVPVFCTLVGCSIIDSRKDDTASVLNPRKIHEAYDEKSRAYAAGQIPISDYYDSLELARSKYAISERGALTITKADQDAVKNYVFEGIGLVDAYCRRWFQGLDDTSRMLAYQNKNVNVITQLGTAALGIASASALAVTAYGAGTTAYAGVVENYNSAFLVAPTASKVRDHIESVMKTEASDLKTAATTLTFKEAYSRLERYADICTHSRAKTIVDTALDLTKTQTAGSNGQVETVKKP